MSRQKVGQSQNGAVHHICRDDLCDQIKKKMYIFYKSYFLKVLKGKKEIVKNDIILESLQM